jgi:homoserine kinase type II
MASYTQIEMAEANNILRLYGLSPVVKLMPLSLGISNSNYRVELADQTILLKISNDKNHQQLRDEQEILLYLNSLGFEYSLKPYTTLKNELVYVYGKYFGVIFPFVDGIPPGPSDYTCQEVGKALARLHSLPHDQNQISKLRRHEEVGFGANEILKYTQSKTCPDDFKTAFLNFYPDQLKQFIDSPFEKGIIHGDLYYDNTLFNNNLLSSVLDFEQAGIGEYILDLGISISGTCLEKGRLISPLINSYLLGYEKIRPLNSMEKRHLNDAIVLGLLSISLWRIKRFKEGNLNPLMADSYRDLINRAYHYFEMMRA